MASRQCAFTAEGAYACGGKGGGGVGRFPSDAPFAPPAPPVAFKCGGGGGGRAGPPPEAAWTKARASGGWATGDEAQAQPQRRGQADAQARASAGAAPVPAPAPATPSSMFMPLGEFEQPIA